MMNSANEISHHTKLYGFIGEYAAQNSISAAINRLFKANNKNAMIIPMNIREDDFYYTISNMKKSHVNGALISNEYTKSVVEILDSASEVVKKSGMCDILIRDKDKLVGDIFSIGVLVKYLKDKNCKKVALIGIGSRAKAFCYLADGFEISYFYDDLEKLMEFSTKMQIPNADINRIAESMEVDFSSFDAVIDFSDFDTLHTVKKLGKINIDMKNKKEFSALKIRAVELEENYIGFDDMLDELGSGAFEFLKEKKHLEDDKSDMKF
ncbi:MAG: hypothetical protein A2513_07435 [Sulfurimonas sp. RIFOXYD12_FULL_33_39]|uniref:hypothetical protein n=1 Tax=unclassified Sulfurimonas TaxID=2623549 RepID=UPI0008ABD140|nr:MULTISPECIES: hypothetical protein [unclassified Sulfurimonas]OHE06808.1 MAG: hypothetical protein A3G74_05055 [Sulfurimonas sp. RIFCSPLOWO2_12_FULL_34_6]OHE09118.1 MAG: hypothetical protein A2513_07435 [Sulfurimonas sp. RIFOXYD12_FULL_33_39]OHE14435.1 MAG: hypothetical protein A2530_10495 [Sulfurimonas sp. RIFOXYD2_FULL_34_21]DAB28484.1 MAG TPA: hypothetical protein CFH78_02190 [Sulfurimonas sp. UBA10385]